jgi:hypothetical protein
LDARSVVEDFCSHAIPLALVYASAWSTSSYTTSILPSMLQIVKRVMEVSGGSGRGGILDIAEN